MEGWLSFSIFLSIAILLLSLLGCLPGVVSTTLGWILPEKMFDRLGVPLGVDNSVFAMLCEILMTFSGAYLVVALFIKSRTRRPPQ